VQTDAEIIALANELDEKLQRIDSYDEQIQQLKNELVELESQLESLAHQLTTSRQKHAESIVKSIKENLILLGMPSAEFVVDISLANQYNEFGKNQLSLLFSANKGSEVKELTKVASGGEMSRLMLCIKFLLAKKSSLPTIIFDEIDTGVSGDIAQKMAAMMHDMAQTMQLITITHLAQIAAKGEFHLHVIKEENESKTVSKMIAIQGEHRIVEIAKMLSNSNPGKAAIENAKELLKA
jgi:DNA repair protein RecN (Recombination protein N)